MMRAGNYSDRMMTAYPTKKGGRQAIDAARKKSHQARRLLGRKPKPASPSGK